MLIPSLLVAKTKYAQTTQNNKFAISLDYLQKEVPDKIDLNFRTSWYFQFWYTWPIMPKAPKITVLQNLCNISRFSFRYQSKTITNYYFLLKSGGREQGSSNNVLLFSKFLITLRRKTTSFFRMFCCDMHIAYIKARRGSN